MNTLPFVLIISGPPAAGKTTLARQLSPYLGIPLLSKDRIKELLFDTLGWSDRAWSRQLGAASVALLFGLIDGQLAAGRSCIAESNFLAVLDCPRFHDLQTRYSFRSLQIHCQANASVLFQRFKQRATSDQRHPGHNDSGVTREEFERVAKACAPLACADTTIMLNTTTFTSDTAVPLIQSIQSWITTI